MALLLACSAMLTAFTVGWAFGHQPSAGAAQLPPLPTIPGVTVPPVTVPSVSVPGVTVPTVSIPGVSTPIATTPGVTTPGVTTPGVSTPGLTTPTVSTPNVSPTISVPGLPVPTTVPSLPPVPVTLPDGSPAPTTAGTNASDAADPTSDAALAPIAGVGAVGAGILGPAAPANTAADGGAEPDGGVTGLTGGPARSPLVHDDQPEAAGSDLAERARSFAPPIGLLVAVVIFLVVQHRIDRRDPKLAGAPLDRLAASIGFE